MLASSRRLPADAHYAADASLITRQRSRSFAGPVAVPLGSAYSEPHHSRPSHRRSASSHHREHGYEREQRELARSHSRHGSVGRHHPDFASVVPANIATAGSDYARGREASRSRVSSSSSHHYEREPSAHASRPNAARRATWQGQPSGATAAFAPALKIHRALACSSSNNGAPAIMYDVTRAPAHDNILAPPPSSFLASLTRRSRAPPQPVPAHMLALPATRPFVPSLTLSLPSSSLPVVLPREWAINAVSMSATDPGHTALTNLDVLHAVYTSLRAPVSRREWDALGAGSGSQRRVAEAYSKRCERTGSQREWDAGVRRVDWLCGRTVLCGVECRPDGGCELVFAKPA